MQIKIDGEIGWDIFADDVKMQLDSADGDIEVLIDSPGGSVFEGVKIYNLLAEYKGKKIITIGSLAASMATYIAMAGDIVKVKDNSTFMIHNAWGFAMGDYREMQKTAEVLQGLTSLLSKKYISKTGKSEKKIRDLMDNESWFFGEEIVKNGFADEIVKTDDQKDKNAALAFSKEKFKALSKKMSEKEEDNDKVAALLKVKNFQPFGDNEDNNLKLELAKLKLKMREV